LKIKDKRKSDLVWNYIATVPSIANFLDQGTTLEKKLVSIYKWVRDLPFEAKLGKRDYYEDLRYIITQKRGSCSPKHYLLGIICEKLGLSVRYLTYPFYWNDLDVPYPNSIKRLLKETLLSYHLAIKVHINREEFFLDATWDPPLGKVGFSTNLMGDELMNTRNAIVPCGKPITHVNALERDKHVKKFSIKKRNIKSEIQFYIAFNDWLEQIRNK